MLNEASACRNVLNIDTQRKGAALRVLQEAGYYHLSLSDYAKLKEGERRTERHRDETQCTDVLITQTTEWFLFGTS